MGQQFRRFGGDATHLTLSRKVGQKALNCRVARIGDDPPHCGFSLGGVAAYDDYSGAETDQFAGGCVADAIAAAGDERDFALHQIIHRNNVADTANRIIVDTAMNGHQLVTADRRILDWTGGLRCVGAAHCVGVHQVRSMLLNNAM